MKKMPGTYSIIFYCLSVILILNGCNVAVPTPTLEHANTATALSKAYGTIVSLTFDDGDADNFSVEPLLKANGLHATFYVTSGRVGSAGFMTWEQLQMLQKNGNEIGGHTLDHVKVEGLDTASLKHQICDDRKNLLDHGLNAVSFAYPFGNYDTNAKQMVKDCGYTSARTIHAGPMPDPYSLGAFPYIVSDTDLSKLMRYVSGARKDGGWVILIFHHVCDSCDYFSVRPDTMNNFILWLAQQQNKGNLKVLTVGEVMSGSSSH